MEPIVISFDTETHLIEPGLLAPPLVCVQWATSSGTPAMAHRDCPGMRQVLGCWLESRDTLVGHNVAYDMGVLAAQWPELLPAIFVKYDRDEVTDTMLREQLIMIGRGTFKFIFNTDTQEIQPVKYSLTDCSVRHFGRHLNKESWRLYYRAFTDSPDITTWPTVAVEFQQRCASGNAPAWVDHARSQKDGEKSYAGMLAADPHEPVRYALEDGSTTLALYESQERYFGAGGEDLLQDQFRQARAAFALHLISAWGVYTDPDAVEKLEADLRTEYNALVFELQQGGIVRADGSADTAKAKEAMVAACAEDGVPIARTKGGDVALSSEACDRFDDLSVIGKYSRFLTLRKTLSNDIKMLHAGAGEHPLQPRYDMADTGRIRCSKPNVTAINRGAGIREAIRPREGWVFAQADFEGLELHTRAAWCLEVIGWSKLAEDLNAGLDVHCVVAADLLRMPYEEVFAIAKKGKKVDPELKKKVKDARQSAKALNFGLPGGLGAKKFVRYAKTNYQVDLTEEQAKAYKAQWMQRQPEMVDFFRLAAERTNNIAKLGDEDCLFVGRRGRNLRYSALCNRRFQALGADAAKEALWRVSRACYTRRPGSEAVLYGSRPVAFIHDEIILETPDGPDASAVAKELGRLMCEAANERFLAKVPVRTEPLLMRLWSKNAEPVYDEDGRTLLPWVPKAS